MDKIVLIGNLVRDPEQRVLNNGDTVTNFTVACNQGKDRNGNERPAKFYRVSAFGKLAEHCYKYLAKGRKVYAEGAVRASTYTGQDGTVMVSMEVTAYSVEFLSAAGSAGNDGHAVPHAEEQNEVPQQQEDGFVNAGNEDLPF